MYDVEKLLDAIEAYFKANLNNKITQINTEKGDTLLDPVNQSAFLLGNLESENKSYSPFVLIQIADVTSSFAGNAVAENYQIEVLMFLQDDYNSTNNWRQVLRYWRALKEVSSDAWDRVAKGMQADISSLAPVSFKETQTSNPMRVFGVQISFTIT
jgi:hypothetical protein